jgi:hypothetical protein
LEKLAAVMDEGGARVAWGTFLEDEGGGVFGQVAGAPGDLVAFIQELGSNGRVILLESRQVVLRGLRLVVGGAGAFEFEEALLYFGGV